MLFVAAAALVLAAACGGGKTAYSVTVAFNDRYTDAGGKAVEDAIHAYDAGAQVLLRESFPPVAAATVHTDASNFCDALRQRLQPRPDIGSIDCARAP